MPRAPIAVAACLSLALAGCISGPGESGRVDLDALGAYYPVQFDGTFAAVVGVPHAVALVMTNPLDRPLAAFVNTTGEAVRLGPVVPGSGWASQHVHEHVLEPGESVLFLVEYEFDAAGGVNLLSTLAFLEPGNGPVDARMVDSVLWPHAVVVVDGTMPVAPGDHVQTRTVGFWENGTSFYTNIAELNGDDAFPAGYDRGDFGGDSLPIYVFDEDRGEQPAGSIDTCHFTTITGYNALLKTQAEGSTGARYLEPEEAYTVDGAQDHFLYGDALVFVNTVSAHDGATGPADTVPSPTGACFDAARYNPLPVPVAP